jgi:hypothetical protein
MSHEVKTLTAEQLYPTYTGTFSSLPVSCCKNTSTSLTDQLRYRHRSEILV